MVDQHEPGVGGVKADQGQGDPWQRLSLLSRLAFIVASLSVDLAAGKE